MDSVKAIIKIQSLVRGWNVRKTRLPQFLYVIQDYLSKNPVKCSNMTTDGRVNSCVDEDIIIDALIKKFKKRVEKAKIRMWYDIKIKDYRLGWLPVNIKTTTLRSADNISNLAPCVYAFTNQSLDLDKEYVNGKMAPIIYEKIKNKQYNKSYKKDYYFLVFNKNNTTEVFINSLLGLKKIVPNINNLPFQVKWSENKEFKFKTIPKQIKTFVKTLQKPQKSWKEKFMENMRSLKI